jgi:hypothetical protein
LLRRLPRDEIPADLIGLLDTWISQHASAQNFTYLSKWILRKGLMSRTIFEALLAWVRTHTDSDDLLHRLSAAGPTVGPHTRHVEDASRWLDAVELCLDYAERHGEASNERGVLDTIICNLARSFGTGVVAARTDDHIQRWLALPFSMNPSVYVHHEQIVPRCYAMALSGRFDRSQLPALGARLRTWVSQWPEYDRKAELIAFIDQHMLAPAETPVTDPNR